jgi:hypothetical protein
VPYQLLCDDANTRPGILAHFRKAILANPRKVTNSFVPEDESFDPTKHDMFQAHDPLAVAHAIHCPSPHQRGSLQKQYIDDTFDGWNIKTRRFGIETEGTLTRGYCVVDRRNLGKARKKGANMVDVEKSEQGEEVPGDTTGSVNTEILKAPATDGQWDVVISSPGIDWFAKTFCSALGLQVSIK